MELLLWLWVLDKRWLLGFKPKLSLYIFAWLIPIVINISMFSFYVYVLNNGVLSHCKYPPYSFHLLDLTPQIVLTTKSVLCFISTLLGLMLIKDLVVNRKSEMNKRLNKAVPITQKRYQQILRIVKLGFKYLL